MQGAKDAITAPHGITAWTLGAARRRKMSAQEPNRRYPIGAIDWKKRKNSTRSGMVRVFLYVQERRGELLRLVGKVVGGLHLNETLLSCELVLSVKC